MLNTRALSELLTKNVHPKLCPSLFAMSPTGTLIAYSTPANIKQVRDQAALISMTLNEMAPDAASADSTLRTLTVQVDAHNIIARRVHPEVLLVLVGSLSPYATRHFNVVIEREGDQRFPDKPGHEDGDLPDVMTKLQDLQRIKLDSLCKFVDADVAKFDESEGPSALIS